MSVRACGRRQSATHHRLASLEEVVATNTVFVTRKEGLRSKSTSTTFPTRSAARRPPVRGACPALENKDDAELQRRREISARRGPRTRRRGIVMPLRGCIFKTFVQISYVKSAFIFTFSAKFVILIKLVLPNLRF